VLNHAWIGLSQLNWVFQNVWFVAAVWMGLALLASLVSIWAGISVALIEILVGVLAGNFLHLHASNEWINFLALLGSGVLTFLAGAEIDPRSLKRVKFIFFVLFFLGGLATNAKSEAVLPAYLIGLVGCGRFSSRQNVGAQNAQHRLRDVYTILLHQGRVVHLTSGALARAGYRRRLASIEIGDKDNRRLAAGASALHAPARSDLHYSDLRHSLVTLRVSEPHYRSAPIYHFGHGCYFERACPDSFRAANFPTNQGGDARVGRIYRRRLGRLSVEDLDHMAYERIAEVELKRSSQDADRTVPRTGS
jgi:hypothetical protein